MTSKWRNFDHDTFVKSVLILHKSKVIHRDSWSQTVHKLQSSAWKCCEWSTRPPPLLFGLDFLALHAAAPEECFKTWRQMNWQQHGLKSRTTWVWGQAALTRAMWCKISSTVRYVMRESSCDTVWGQDEKHNYRRMLSALLCWVLMRRRVGHGPGTKK